MKIYFAGSIRSGREDAEIYFKLIDYLNSNYGKVLSEHVGLKNLVEGIPTIKKNLTESEIHNQDLKWLNEADVVIAEVSKPSLGVGYELGRVYNMNKPVLCLYRITEGKKLSAMIAGSDKFVVINYVNVEDAFVYIDIFFKGLDKK